MKKSKRLSANLGRKKQYLGEQSMLQAQLSFQRQLNQEKEEKFEIKLDEEKLLFNLKKLNLEQKEFLNKIEKISTN